MEIFRQEHPNPQWERKGFKNLNGEWEFDFDFGKSAVERKAYKSAALPRKINVPFCPESKLSGIEYTDFINAVCYRRTFELTEKELSGRVIIHFGAVDFSSYIYINGEEAGRHTGGFSSFEFDITGHVQKGENTVFVIAEDDARSPFQPRGKQSESYFSKVCDYTRTTGIWQTVWLEFLPENYIKNAKYYPDIKSGKLTIIGEAVGGGRISAAAFFNEKRMGETAAEILSGHFSLVLELSETILWQPGEGNLYDLVLKFEEDEVKSYFGMRNICLDGMKFLINEKSVFQRLVLDQGFYPDGVYTAPTEADLIKDIEISIAAGFNGARLHQKVFEPRFLYHCDRLGYLVWGEYGNWGTDYRCGAAVENFACEWMEIIDRDFNHPAIIGWCPANETWGYEEINSRDRFLELIYKLTKRLDSTRPCIDTSGNYHAVTDIFDVHNYEQDTEKFKKQIEKLEKTGVIYDNFPNAQHYGGEPTFVSEYGGLGWNLDSDSWGYGDTPKTEEEFISRYKGLTDALLDSPSMFGFCYTQLYDIEQEKNGLYTYERNPKFSMEIFKKINSRKAKIED